MSASSAKRVKWQLEGLRKRLIELGPQENPEEEKRRQRLLAQNKEMQELLPPIVLEVEDVTFNDQRELGKAILKLKKEDTQTEIRL